MIRIDNSEYLASIPEAKKRGIKFIAIPYEITKAWLDGDMSDEEYFELNKRLMGVDDE